MLKLYEHWAFPSDWIHKIFLAKTKCWVLTHQCKILMGRAYSEYHQAKQTDTGQDCRMFHTASEAYQSEIWVHQ